MLTIPGQLPGVPPILQVADQVAVDITGIDGESMGGISDRGVFRTAPNTTGQTVYYCVCPNDLEANQVSDGGINRLVIASLAFNEQDTIFYRWKIADTKSGRGRVFTSVSWSLLHSTTKRVQGVVLDASVPWTMFRKRVIKADGTNTAGTLNWFIQAIPGITGLTTSYQAWSALGLP